MHAIFSRLLPETASNDYRGSRVALAVFALITLITLGRSLVHVFAPDGGAQSIASVPLDSFTPDGADAVIFVFSLWGLAQLLMGGVYVIVLLRYRTLVPLMYGFVLVEYSMRLVIGQMKPIVTAATAPGEIGNYVMVPLAALMLALTLWPRRRP